MSLMSALRKVFPSQNDRELKKITKVADKIEALEPEVSRCSDEELQQKTPQFRERLAQGETLDDLLPEAFAVVREASKRVLGLRHFYVQLLGGIVLHQGKISEMKTGEGKTLVATLPAYLNALPGKGVHIVTVNDYLAQRDRESMGKIYEFLGLTVGMNLHDMDEEEKRAAYAADITFGTNNEYGFDYLRDNMVLYKELMVQRPLNFAIVDEVDSILIDEARTPLIISGQANKATDLYYAADRFAKRLKREDDYTLDEKTRTVTLTEQGVDKAENAFDIDNLFDTKNMLLNHHINQALKANVTMHRDEDYVVNEDGVIIVDEFTGRLMHGRRYSDGLHQAIEAKEGLQVQKESMTLATITLQNYFRMYQKLAGMTGTAKTEEEEFRKIYGMDVVVIPTNKPMIRKDETDILYKTEEVKYQKVVDEIVARHAEGQPVLVGTVSIANSERLSKMLKKKGVPHNVLNAKFHRQEAEIIAQAGQHGQVTIATNMAGRGTDIVLGDGVAERGGLHIIGTERHESRRIDNQLRGRAGRQGDPGSSQFFLSFEDELMRRYGQDRLKGIMEKVGMDDEQEIEGRLFTKAVETAQKHIEGANFDTRRIVLQYDNVMNEQRNIIYKQRREVLEADSVRDIVRGMIKAVIGHVVELHTPEEEVPEDWDVDAIVDYVNGNLLKEPVRLEVDDIKMRERDEVTAIIEEKVLAYYDQREAELTREQMDEFEKVIVLRTVDRKWMDHIDAMEQLRQGIHLRAYGQKDPLQEYQFEGFNMFNQMVFEISEEVSKHVMRTEISSDQLEREEVAVEQEATTRSYDQPPEKEEPRKRQPVRVQYKAGRNDPCPCGSGKKYKQCCGAPGKTGTE